MNHHSKPIFVRIEQTVLQQKFTNFHKHFDELVLGKFRQNAGESYSNKSPTILVPHFSEVYLSKHAKIRSQDNFYLT